MTGPSAKAMPGSWPERNFPHLNAASCQITSPATPAYNCIAWAAGSNTEWWDPSGQYYWPPDIPAEFTIEALIQLYEGLGFTVCIGGTLEPDFDKIAIYAIQLPDRRQATHAARQLDSGEWTSKLGACEDISHTYAESVNGPGYGEVVYFMSRPKPRA